MGKEWFSKARFGMFIHWGIYSILARGEWIRLIERIPSREYEALSWKFKAEKYNPEEWVELAEHAGMRYMVLTTRHHDGFSLFDSEVSDFTAPKTGAKRDLVAEFVEACRKRDMRIGFYYSLLDWRYPAYFLGPEKDPEGWREFVEYVHVQVRELCTNYGRVDILWYDGGWPWKAEDWRAAELNAMVRKLQPDILINDRSGLPEDFDTPEQQIIPSKDPKRMWEACMTMNDSWGYSAGDKNWKSTRQLIHALVYCASGGGNLLLNVGPKADGTIPLSSVRRLREIGRWMKVNGESIYGSERSNLRGSAVGPVTVKDGRVYVHVLRWPGREFTVTCIKNRVLSAYILPTKQELTVIQEGERITLKGLPKRPLDPYDTVIVLELDGDLEALPLHRYVP